MVAPDRSIAARNRITPRRQAPDTLDAFCRSWLFGVLPEQAKLALGRQMQAVPVTRGQVIFRQGALDDCLFVVIAGKVKLSYRNADGRQSLVDLWGPSACFGELSLVDGSPRPGTAEAITDGWIVGVPGAVVRSLIEEHPSFASRFVQRLAQQIKQVEDDAFQMATVDVPARLAMLILRLGQFFGTEADGQLRIDHGLDQHELAQYVGSTRTTVNRILIAFEARGWIKVEGKSFVVIDVDRIRSRSRPRITR